MSSHLILRSNMFFQRFAFTFCFMLLSQDKVPEGYVHSLTVCVSAKEEDPGSERMGLRQRLF